MSSKSTIAVSTLPAFARLADVKRAECLLGRAKQEQLDELWVRYPEAQPHYEAIIRTFDELAERFRKELADLEDQVKAEVKSSKASLRCEETARSR